MASGWSTSCSVPDARCGSAQRARFGTAIPNPSTSASTGANDCSSTPVNDDHRTSLCPGVELDARRHRPDLSAGVEHQRRADAVDPGAVGHERSLMDVPAEHDVGPVLVDPPRRGPRRRSTACRSSSWAMRRAAVVHPQPAATADEGGVVRQLTVDVVSGAWAVHHGQTVTRSSAVPNVVRSTKTPELLAACQPAAPLVVLVARVEIVIARARDDRGLGGKPGEVLEHHGDLRVGLDDRRDVEEVAGDDDEVEVGGDGRDPVELLQRVVQIGHQQDLHERGCYRGDRTVRQDPCRDRSVTRAPRAAILVR